MELSGARVLLTGASGGVGAAVATAFAQRGAQLILTGRRTDVLTDLATRVGGRTIAADLSLPHAPAEVLAAAGEVDVLVAAAGLPATGHVWDYPAEDLDRALTVNMRAPIMLARLASDSMRERRFGHVVFLSSLSGRYASSRMSLYNATKFGLRGFALALREDLRPYGVGVSSVLPGPIRDAGMIAESGVRIPRLATRSPAEVGEATVRAVRDNKGELVVAPWSLRATTTLGTIAPSVSAALARHSGNDALMAAISDGQRNKR